MYHLVKGTLVAEVRRLHDIHGSVVRIAPDELSYACSNAWKDIYGFRRGKLEMSKDTAWYKSDAQPVSIVSANREKHAHFRRLMSRGFSETALQEQEPIIQSYVNLFMERIRGLAEQGKAVNMVTWFNVSQQNTDTPV